MSREIKFRGLRVPDHLKKKNDGTWVYGYFYKAADGSSCIDEWKVALETVGEYTGLKDKYGVEIYEGDVVRGSYGLYVVEFAGAAFRLKTPDDRSPDLLPVLENTDRIEVIGKIYENPELTAPAPAPNEPEL